MGRVDLRNHRILWGSLLLSSLIVSIVAWLVFVPNFKSVVLYFPAAENNYLESEIHFIPWGNNESAQIRHAVQALAIGPLSMNCRHLIPSDTVIKAIFIKDKQLWIDFNQTVQAPDPDCPLKPKDRISALIRSLKFNFKNLNSIKILVEGQELVPFPPFAARKS